MTRFPANLSRLCAVLLGSTALGLLPAPEVYANVGVTTATDGDPLGKPPTLPERVLRIGIDVQANELITTGANDRAHLVFLDGSSLTVGPNARLTIDKFVFDPKTKTGDLAINASRGVLRLVGGKISKSKAIEITTPSSTIGIRGGITILDVEGTQTKVAFVFGIDLTVMAMGRKQTMTRPGSQVTTVLGGVPGRPTLLAKNELDPQLKQLEGRVSRGSSRSGAGSADEASQSSGFSKQNSGAGPGNGGKPPLTTPPVQPAFATNALTNRNVEQQTALAASLPSQQNPAAMSQSQSVPPPAPPPPTPVTQVIVTRGAFAAEPSYTNFNSQTLGVTRIPQNNVLLVPTGVVSDGNATVSLADGRSLTVPWLPGKPPFAISLTDPTFGQLNGSGFVSPTGDYFYFSFTDPNGKRLGVVGGTPTLAAQFPVAGFAAHTVANLGAPGNLPFSNQLVGGDAQLKAAASTSPLYSVYAPNIAPMVGGSAPGAQAAGFMQATISIAGQGLDQKSYMAVVIGDYVNDYNNNTAAGSGALTATYRLGAAQQIGRQASAQSTFDTGGGNSIYGPNANAMFFTPDGVATNIASSGGVVTGTSTVRASQASLDQPFTNLGGSDYYSVTSATRTDAPSGLGQSRTTRTMNGYVGGLIEQRDSQGNFTTRLLGAGSPQPTNVIITTDAATNRVEALVTVNQWDGASTSATFRLGGTTGARAATSSFIDDSTYALRDRPAGVLPGTTSITVNGNTSTGAAVQSQTSLVSYGTAPVAAFFQGAGATPCTCEFMTWGWWGGDISYGSSSVYSPGARDRLNLATYVGGTLSRVVDLNALNQQSATATYSGHLVGNVANNGASYVAAGSYTNQWSFGQRSGIATVKFDGATFGGGVTANTVMNGNGPTFTSTGNGIGSSGVPGRSLTLNGAFFASPTDPAKGQGGSFAVTGTGYQAGGTFAAQKP